MLLAPWTYEAEFALKHTLAIELKPSNSTSLPESTNTCEVTAMFDKGTAPHVHSVPMSGGEASLLVSFPDVPLGGNVTVTALFYDVPSDPNASKVLLGKGTTGLVENGTAQLSASIEAPGHPADAWLRGLRLAIEQFTGFFYVLSYDQVQLTYRMDVFHPDQSDATPISTTHGVNGARLTVDYFRSRCRPFPPRIRSRRTMCSGACIRTPYRAPICARAAPQSFSCGARS